MEPLVNMQLITNEVSIKNNNLPNGQFTINPKFTRNIGAIDESHAFTELKVEILNSEDAPFPVDVVVSLTGLFDISTLPEKDVDAFLKFQAVHILLPYIRSMVSSITASSLMPPILLPIVDAKALFND